MKTWALLLAFIGMLAIASVVRAEQNVVVVFDDSGSMNEGFGSTNKMEAAKSGLFSVLAKMPPDTNIGVVCLNKGWVLSVGHYSVADIHKAIDPLAAGGGTPLGAAMKVGGDALFAWRAKHTYGTYRLLIITDGEAEDSSLVEKYSGDLRTRNVVVDVIGVKMASNHQLATKVNSYRKADDPAALNKAINESLAEVGAQASDISSYDEIAPLPDDFAKVVLAVLVVQNNAPVGDPPARPVIDGQVVPPPEGTVVPSAGGGKVCLIVIGGLLALIAIIVVITKANRCGY